MIKPSIKPDDLKQYMNTHDVAERLSCSEKYVRQLISNNCLKASKIGRHWIIKSRDLEQFVDALQGEDVNNIEEMQAVIETKKMYA